MESYKNKYEEALKKAEQWYNVGDATETDKALLEQMFPELKEPKFKVDNYIISKNNPDIIYKIICVGINELNKHDYVCEHVGRQKEYIGKIYNIAQDKVDSNFILWTIKNAKAGDVLATDDGVCIFDGTLEEGKYPFAYCGITKRGFDFYNVRLPFSRDKNIHPATKEQRDAIFTKMKEEGYEWDAERLEPMKTENKHESHWKLSEQCPEMVAIKTAINVLGKGTLTGKQLINLYNKLKN